MLTTTAVRILSVLDGAPDLSTTTLAMVCGIPPTTLGDALRDKRYLGAERELRVYLVAKRCAEILDALQPLSIPKGSWQTLKDLHDSGRSPKEIQTAITALFNTIEVEVTTVAESKAVNDAPSEEFNIVS